jgi:hypothetical protein
MLVAGCGLGDRYVVAVGGGRNIPTTPTSLSADLCLSLCPTASRDVRLITVRGDGTLQSSVVGELPMPLAGHAVFVEGTDVWTVGGFSSDQLAPKCLCRLKFAMPMQPTEHASGAESPKASPAYPTVDEIEVYNAENVSIFAASTSLVLESSREKLWVAWGGLTNHAASLKTLSAEHSHDLLRACRDARSRTGPTERQRSGPASRRGHDVDCGRPCPATRRDVRVTRA